MQSHADFTRMIRAAVMASAIFCTPVVRAQEGKLPVSPVESRTLDSTAEIRISARHEEMLQWQSMDVHLLIGQVSIQQGEQSYSGARMAVFVSPTAEGFDLAVYGEEVTVAGPTGRQTFAALDFRLQSTSPPELLASSTTLAGSRESPLLQRALPRLYPGQQSGWIKAGQQTPAEIFSQPIPVLPAPGGGGGERQVRIRPRATDAPLVVESSTVEGTVPEERMTVITGGVQVLIDGLDAGSELSKYSPDGLELSADRVVIWTQAGASSGIDSGSTVIQSADDRFQVYLEGNIVIRQAGNTIRASSGFYDAAGNQALLLKAELRAEVPGTDVTVRVRGERLRQLSREKFHIQNAWVTTSPYGEPGYRLQASDIFLEPGRRGATGIDPQTGQPVVRSELWVRSLNNQFVLGNIPLLYLPVISGPAEDPRIPLRRAAVSSDRVFGVQLSTVWDLEQLMGLSPVPGRQLDLLADYRSDRGVGAGLQGTWNRQSGPNRWVGDGRIFYQNDHGTDNLGRDRRGLQPDSENRGEVTGSFRRESAWGQLFGEIGYLSDRNYLEQYDEIRFDSGKDVETILGARRDMGEWSGQLWGRVDLNGFEATTEWLPRADLYTFSKPLGAGLFYWDQHSSVGYGKMQALPAPADLQDPYSPLGLTGMRDASGVVAMTRHRLSAPMRLGILNVEPWVSGEAAYWGGGTTGEDETRLLLNTGIQARFSATRVFPFVRNTLLGVNGLAHRHETLLEYAYTQSSMSLDEVPQFNELDDNAQERFRSRYTLASQIFPGALPDQFDPRNYALRTGAGLWTSAPYHEVADSFQSLRLGFRERLQTHSGSAETQRTRDWMTLEYGATFFPKSERDNFGEDFGLLYSRYRWNLSDRTGLHGDAWWDLFDNAGSMWSVGLLSQRSTRGSVYVGLRNVRVGDYLDSRTLVSSYTYRMSPKWISTASFAYDLAQDESRGTSLTISRVGLDWILHFGFGIDFSRDNVGLGLSLEPRFGPPSGTNLATLMGMR